MLICRAAIGSANLGDHWRADEDFADRLLSGVAGAAVPRSHTALVGALAALLNPPSADELAGEAEAIAIYLLTRNEQPEREIDQDLRAGQDAGDHEDQSYDERRPTESLREASADASDDPMLPGAAEWPD
jgi:hypothetical protein